MRRVVGSGQPRGRKSASRVLKDTRATNLEHRRNTNEKEGGGQVCHFEKTVRILEGARTHDLHKSFVPSSSFQIVQHMWLQ